MKTQEEVVRRYAVGPINIYRIYQEGYQDRELDEWSSFRREAAKDILCVLIGNKETISAQGKRVGGIEVSNAIILADELIKQLQEEKK